MTLKDVLSVIPHESQVCIKDEEGNVLYEGGCDGRRIDDFIDRHVCGVDPVFLVVLST